MTISVDEYHDGFRIHWDQHNFADNEGISYHLQVEKPVHPPACACVGSVVILQEQEYVYLH